MSTESGFGSREEPTNTEQFKADAEIALSAKRAQGDLPEAVLNREKFFRGEGKATLLQKLKAGVEIEISANPESIRKQCEFHQDAATILALESAKRKE